MAKHRSAKEVAAILKAIEKQRVRGVPVKDCCKAQGVTEQTYYRWRGDAASDKDDASRQLKELASEVERLKRVVADVMLDNQMLRDVAKKKW